MELGFWLNDKTGKMFRIDEHERWIRKWTNAKKLGISKNGYDDFLKQFEPVEDREKNVVMGYE